MKISLIQFDIVSNDPKANLDRIEKLSKGLPVSDLIILPENFNTGFLPGDTAIAVESAPETLQWMKRIASEKGCAVCGGLLAEDSGKVFNRLYFITSDRDELIFYNKRHLFLGDEKESISPGSERVVVPFMNWRINLQICYDLRFPVWSRNRNDYDLLIYAANWPEPRREVWKALLKARAIENQCYVAGVNRIGIDQEGIKYAGESVIIDPYGREVMALTPFEEACGTLSLDMGMLESFRKKFPVWIDRDEFMIIT
jgi:predicted amidohydrolase